MKDENWKWIEMNEILVNNFEDHYSRELINSVTNSILDIAEQPMSQSDAEVYSKVADRPVVERSELTDMVGYANKVFGY